jgi:hypothetical protein
VETEEEKWGSPEEIRWRNQTRNNENGRPKKAKHAFSFRRNNFSRRTRVAFVPSPIDQVLPKMSCSAIRPLKKRLLMHFSRLKMAAGTGRTLREYRIGLERQQEKKSTIRLVVKIQKSEI